ncbi:MAG: Rpn family recombination-promoting nuclease/putative transposase [Sandaracinaceae bacterium]|nr:Rpn family recombination-promoting nuclease/putative transposase [Sandaracinaceae bacterium]
MTRARSASASAARRWRSTARWVRLARRWRGTRRATSRTTRTTGSCATRSRILRTSCLSCARCSLAPSATRSRLSSLRREPGTFVDRASEARTDLLFSARLGEQRVLVYVLVEHQSRPDAYMPLRMYRCVGRVLDAQARQQRRKRLPVVVPVVLHHGAGGWTAPRRLSDLFDWDQETRALLAPYVPDFELLIDDLVRVPELELLAREGAPIGRLTVWVLRAVRVGFDPALIGCWAQELDRAAEGDRGAILHILQCLGSADEGEAVIDALRQAPLSERMQEVVMGYHKKWLGLEEGMQQGNAAGPRRDPPEAAAAPFPPGAKAIERRVLAASLEDLDRWTERVLFADSLDDVLR